MSFIWGLADERGNSRIRPVLAIGEESELSLGETCRIREQDVDLDGLRIFVCLPNKTNCERWETFSDKTARFVREWLPDEGRPRARDFRCEGWTHSKPEHRATCS